MIFCGIGSKNGDYKFISIHKPNIKNFLLSSISTSQRFIKWWKIRKIEVVLFNAHNSCFINQTYSTDRAKTIIQGKKLYCVTFHSIRLLHLFVCISSTSLASVIIVYKLSIFEEFIDIRDNIHIKRYLLQLVFNFFEWVYLWRISI